MHRIEIDQNSSSTGENNLHPAPRMNFGLVVNDTINEQESQGKNFKNSYDQADIG